MASPPYKATAVCVVYVCKEQFLIVWCDNIASRNVVSQFVQYRRSSRAGLPKERSPLKFLSCFMYVHMHPCLTCSGISPISNCRRSKHPPRAPPRNEVYADHHALDSESVSPNSIRLARLLLGISYLTAIKTRYKARIGGCCRGA